MHEDRVIIHNGEDKTEHIRPQRVAARVDLVKVTISMDGSLVDDLVKLGSQGIVIEAFGGGHLMPSILPSLKKAIDNGVVLVVTSRCQAGELYEHTYAFEGSETNLRNLGAIMASSISGQKARIKLALALSSAMNKEQIRVLFER